MAGHAARPLAGDVVLRDVAEDDLPILFAHQLDSDANRMAAFTAHDPTDWDAFTTHWRRMLGNETITNKAVVFDGQVAGHVSCFEHVGARHVGYWIGKGYWGKGIATAALSEFLDYVRARPLYARVAKDNIASIRVLKKCGFTISGEDSGFSNARGAEVEEFIFTLEATKEKISKSIT